MPSVRVGDVEIDYATFGDASGPPLLLMRGLGTQRIQWPERFLGRLVDAGLHVITPDNRDVGLSTHLHDAPVPPMGDVVAALAEGRDPGVAYTLADMADDHARLLDALDVGPTHICGMSMGGMIAQLIALRHRASTRSLVSIFSSTGAPGLPGPAPEVMAALMEPAPAERDAYVAYTVRTAKVFAGDALPIDESERAVLAGRCFDRAFDPPGIARQVAAVAASPDRTEALRTLDLPTLVIHGEADPLVLFEHGVATAEAIPGAHLEAIPDMGHDLVDAVVDRVADAIIALTRRA